MFDWGYCYRDRCDDFNQKIKSIIDHISSIFDEVTRISSPVLVHSIDVGIISIHLIGLVSDFLDWIFEIGVNNFPSLLSWIGKHF